MVSRGMKLSFYGMFLRIFRFCCVCFGKRNGLNRQTVKHLLSFILKISQRVLNQRQLPSVEHQNEGRKIAAKLNFFPSLSRASAS